MLWTSSNLYSFSLLGYYVTLPLFTVIYFTSYDINGKALKHLASHDFGGFEIFQ